MISIALDTRAINARLDALAKTAKDSARPAAQAGAQVLYEEVVRRVPVSDQEHSTKGKKHTFQPGNLRAAIYQAFVQDESGQGRATYRISWNKRKAFYGHFVEHGTSRMAARPFLRPSFDAMEQKALSAARAVMAEQIKGTAP